MAEEEKKYVVYGMRAKCSEGSMENYISTDVGHGVVYQGNPLLNANDHTPQVNLTHFGDCHSKLIYEEAKKQADEKYKADADDGFFAKAGKFIAKNVTKAALTAKEYLGANKCELDTPLPWMFANSEHMIDGAPALTMESQCACRFGGVISIVPVEDEAEAATEEEAEDAEGIAAVNIMPIAAKGIVMAKSPETSGEEEMDGPWAGVTKAIAEALKAGKEAAGKADPKMYYIDKYVNEETLEKINPDEWDCDVFKETYGDDVFEEMKKYMYEYGITDETSILMFLSTIGDETGYGRSTVQGVIGNPAHSTKDGELPEISCKLGVGLLQVTGYENQQNFIRYKYFSSETSPEEKEIIEDFFGEISAETKLDSQKTAGFICKYYPVESAMWYWAIYDEKGKSANAFVEEHKNGNQHNVFYATQGITNGTQILMRSLDRIAECEIDYMIKKQDGICEYGEEHGTGYCLYHNDGEIEIHTYGPYGWDKRLHDWENASKLLSEETSNMKSKGGN